MQATIGHLVDYMLDIKCWMNYDGLRKEYRELRSTNNCGFVWLSFGVSFYLPFPYLSVSFADTPVGFATT